MGAIKKPEKVMLITGLLFTDESIKGQAVRILEKKYGPVHDASDIVPFHHTDYYNDEMGEGILRQYLAFSRLIRREKLSDIKRTTNAIEKRFSEGESRAINIDPGYVDMSKLVLASTKDYAHRLYIGKGIFAEVTLMYQKGAFQELPWTYPDYKDAATKSYFIDMRVMYRDILKKGR